MNLDFSAKPAFAWYVVLLALSGVLMLILAAIGNRMKGSERLINAVAGSGFIGYAVYLAFISDSDSYTIFFYAFILPVLLIVNFVKSQFGARQAA